MKHGAIEWIEIPSKDASASPKFYESVFGWKIQRSEQMPEYPMFSDPSGNVGGGFDLRGKPAAAGGVLLYISVDSIDRILPTIESHGGTMQKPKTQISPEVGWWASFKDPAGNTIGLFERAHT
jgi:predicted enzyme related to lactoylglutathione lyase